MLLPDSASVPAPDLVSEPAPALPPVPPEPVWSAITSETVAVSPLSGEKVMPCALPSLAIELGMPEVPHFAMNSGAVVNTLAWTMQRSGLLTATVGLIAQGETVAGASATGAASDFEIVRFGQFNGAVQRDGAALGQHRLGADQLCEQPRPDRDDPQRRHDRRGGPVDRRADRHHRRALRRPDAA